MKSAKEHLEEDNNEICVENKYVNFGPLYTLASVLLSLIEHLVYFLDELLHFQATDLLAANDLGTN